MDGRSKIYWHEAFFEALQLEFHQYKYALEFDNEYRLSEEALRMDVLVIKKDNDIQIEKNIGRIFKKYNIFEYKSELDYFSLWDYNKVLGYAFMYSAFEKVRMSDITISISLTIYPRELIKILKTECGLKIQKFNNGVYHIIGDVVPIQLLESKNLPENENVFLRNLRSNLSSEDMLKTLQYYKERKSLNNKNVFLDRLIKANPNAFMEAMNMFTEGVREIFLKGAEEYGWLNARISKYLTEDREKIAKKMLARGDTVEDVSEIMEMSIDIVNSMKDDLDKTVTK